MEKDIINYINQEKKMLDLIDIKELTSFIETLDDCLKNNRKIYIFGNGGSSATASHFQGDFNKQVFKKTDKRFNIICLNNDLPLMMAISNDFSFEDLFAFQMYNKISSDDVVIAISGSGNSMNVINGVKYAKKEGALIIGLTGFDGGLLGKLSDIHLNSGINDMQITEDFHIIINHLVIQLFMKKYGEGKYNE